MQDRAAWNWKRVRPRKRAAVLAVGVASLLAMLDVGSASATRLCTAPGVFTFCPKAIVPKGTPIKMALVGKAKFEIGLTNVECSSSFIGGETTNEGGFGGGVPVDIKLQNRSFSECGACETEVLGSKWDGDFWGTGNIDGFLLFEDEFKFTCAGGWCIYDDYNFNEGIVKGGEPAKVEVKLQTLTLRAGSTTKCMQYPTWTAIYEVTSVSPLYVTEN
jgi:hypothetical protein